MKRFTRDEIIQATEELAEMISSLEEVQFYQEAEKAINGNEKVNSIVAEIKKLQKQSVNFLHYGKKEAYKQTEEKIATLQAELDQLPIVQQFQHSQVEVNQLLQEVTSLIEKEVDEKMQK